MIWENGIEICIISCMKRVATPGSMHDTGSWGWCTGTTQRDGMGREEGISEADPPEAKTQGNLPSYSATCTSTLETHSHLPPHPIPQGHPSAPALSTLSHALNLDWRFISYMILYMFQCHSPKSSHRLPLPHSPKDCSIH